MLFWILLVILLLFLSLFYCAKKITVKPYLLMMVVPFILTIDNDNERIKRAKMGEATVKYMFERSGELDEYDQIQDIRICTSNR